jgi:integrase/recombinase XerD
VTLSEGIDRYLVRKRSGGLAYTKAESQFRGLHRRLGDVQLNQVTTKDVSRYLDGPLTSNITWRAKYQLLYHFFEFWSSRGEMPDLVMPPARPYVRQTFVPYVFTRDEIRALLKATVVCQAKVSCTIEAQTLRTLILVLYGTGARIDELLRLQFKDIDLKRGTIIVRSNRFQRFRKLPISRDLMEIIRKYLKWMLRKEYCGHLLFVRKDGTPLVGGVVTHNFQRLRQVAGVTRHDQTQYQPRMHDLRHTFAVHRITSWIRKGADLNRMLPALAAYMGQVGLGSTERYLLLTPERFRKELNKLSSARGKGHWRNDMNLMRFLAAL